MIDGVIVHQRGEMHELHDRRERVDPWFGRIDDAAGEQCQRGPKHLAAHLEQVTAHLADQRQLVRHDALHFLDDLIEGRAHGGLDVAQGARGRRARTRNDTAHRVAFSSSFKRSAVSRN
jgi:hypothetical protein